MIFRDPWFLILIPVVAVLIFLAQRRTKQAGLRFSSGELIAGLRESRKVRFSKYLFFLRILCSILFVIALARPQSVLKETVITSEGIDLVLAVDVSTSMLAEDFKIADKKASRLEAIKEMSREFIRQRENDRIGMVIFAAGAYTVCPLTLDHDWVLQNLDRVEIGLIEDNTAIGLGLSAALNRLKESRSKGKVVILLTDGRNNAGDITPLTAATAARVLKIKVYTVGAGSNGLAPYPVTDPFGKTIYRMIPLDLDEDLLNQIASSTGAKYFRAMDIASLKETFLEIDRLEKSPIEQKVYQEYQELFHLFLIPGLVLLCLEIILKNTLLRKVP
jgi:Ca-activated chloride channel family protein